MNPIALGMILLGILIFVVGLLFFSKQKKTAGIVISFVGLGTAAAPILITLFLFG
jgi:hypothetical protein